MSLFRGSFPRTLKFWNLVKNVFNKLVFHVWLDLEVKLKELSSHEVKANIDEIVVCEVTTEFKIFPWFFVYGSFFFFLWENVSGESDFKNRIDLAMIPFCVQGGKKMKTKLLDDSLQILQRLILSHKFVNMLHKKHT